MSGIGVCPHCGASLHGPRELAFRISKLSAEPDQFALIRWRRVLGSWLRSRTSSRSGAPSCHDAHCTFFPTFPGSLHGSKGRPGRCVGVPQLGWPVALRVCGHKSQCAFGLLEALSPHFREDYRLRSLRYRSSDGGRANFRHLEYLSGRNVVGRASGALRVRKLTTGCLSRRS